MSSSLQRPPMWMGVPLKRISLGMLTVQNSVLLPLMHYSRVMPLVGGRRFLPSTAIVLAEVIKLSTSLTMALYDISATRPNLPASSLFTTLLQSVFAPDSWNMAIPAVLFTLQNSLQYIGVSNLDASTCQITYQLKILTTALFSVILLGRTLTPRKWLSLLLLTLGVAIVQIPLDPSPSDIRAFKDNTRGNWWLPRGLDDLGRKKGEVKNVLAKRSATYQGMDEDYAMNNPKLNPTLGLAAVLTGCVVASLGAVYFEKILKDHRASQSISSNRSQVSLWVRNVQLSIFSLMPALCVGVIIKDGQEVSTYGFLSGYNWVVWLTVLFEASGGLIVSMVINFADNIAKNFATSISILISFIASVWFFDLSISFPYVLGTCIVLSATWLYNSQDGQVTPQVIIADYEKQQPPRFQPGYFDELESVRMPMSPMRMEGALTTSRPGTPSLERHHFRSPSGRRNMDKRDA